MGACNTRDGPNVEGRVVVTQGAESTLGSAMSGRKEEGVSIPRPTFSIFSSEDSRSTVREPDGPSVHSNISPRKWRRG